MSKIADKVSCEGLIELRRTRIEERMNLTRENYRMMREELVKIVYWNPDDAPAGVPKPLARGHQDRRNVFMMDLALLGAEIANGMHKKPIESIMRNTDTTRAAIIASWKRGGWLLASLSSR